MRDIDNKIRIVQASTRTTFRAFCPYHNKLRMRSRFYYNWHLKNYSRTVHLCTLVGTSLACLGLVFYSYRQVIAADQPPQTTSAATSTAAATPATSASDSMATSIESSVLLQSLSKLATDQTLKTISDKIGSVPGLSSEQTQTEIRNKIETNLAKDTTILGLIDAINKGSDQQQTALVQLSSLVSKIASSSAVDVLTAKIETGLAKDDTLKEIQSILDSGLGKDDTLKEISRKIETGLARDSTLQDIQTTLNSGLSKDQTLQDIKSKLETGLAKDDTLKEIELILSSNLGKDQTLQDIKAKLESGLAKDETLKEIQTVLNSGLSKDQTLQDIKSKIETGLAKDSTLADLKTTLNASLQEIQSKIETGLAKDATLKNSLTDLSGHVDAITNRLNQALNVTIDNWVSSIGINNFPSTYPSSSVEKAQDSLGTDTFNKSEEFESWALRKDYAKSVFSGELINPKSGAEVDAIKITVPANHTYYLYKITYSTTSAKNTNFKLYHKPSGGTENYVDKIVVPSLDSKEIAFSRKIKAGDDFRLTLEPVSSASLTSTSTIFYYDLPWAE